MFHEQSADHLQDVHRLQVLSPTECQDIIDLMESGEDGDSTSWDTAPDTVDRRPVYQQTIMLVTGYAGLPKRQTVAPRRFVYKPEAYRIVEKACREHLESAIARLYFTSVNDVVLNWAYVRRYDPQMRPMLQEHCDVTDVTVNIPLCNLMTPDDQVLYIFNGQESHQLAQHKRQFLQHSQGAAAVLADAKEDPEEWYRLFQVRLQPRESWNREFGRLYPEAALRQRSVRTHQGEALIHPGAFNHGLLPVTTMKRYSLLLFFSIRRGLSWGRRFLPRNPARNENALEICPDLPREEVSARREDDDGGVPKHPAQGNSLRARVETRTCTLIDNNVADVPGIASTPERTEMHSQDDANPGAMHDPQNDCEVPRATLADASFVATAGVNGAPHTDDLRWQWDKDAGPQEILAWGHGWWRLHA
ncbi:hypothetical protein CYMTET_14490 [Cymbomonas tetramitiformis]|uniref:Uncharacterized protein n=1 Tax=Cymbomonas tetramitiformis TaxID=36881 RepID=A0AAE0L9Y8_9CHLO|nr:hypothetical protein CYMTET_14490 [Cymbomonas tetramitiformis]